MTLEDEQPPTPRRDSTFAPNAPTAEAPRARGTPHTVRGVLAAGREILAAMAGYVLPGPGGRPMRKERIIVFTRYPLPGQAKTRLIPALGPLGAAELQREMTMATVATARAAGRAQPADVEVRYAGGNRRKMRRWLGGSIALAGQGGGDLGTRMRRTLATAFSQGCRRAVLIGTDCPHLTPDDLHDAFDALSRCDLVLGPSTDGGYWLIGLRRQADVFSGVAWSTSDVLGQTLELARAAGLRTHLLAERSDVDTPADLVHVPASLRPGGPYLSVIVPALNEADHVARAVASAARPGVEVLLCDGGSTDDTCARAAQAGARVLACPRGRARQMNHAAAGARGRVLLFLHADTVLPARWDEMVFDALSDSRVAGGAFTYATDLDTPLMNFLSRWVNFRSRRLGMPYGDQGLFVRRDVFEALGGFDDLPIAEDLHFVRRLRRRGELRILPGPAVTSARRSRRLGVVRTGIVNRLVAAGCHLGVPIRLLARLYHAGE